MKELLFNGVDLTPLGLLLAVSALIILACLLPVIKTKDELKKQRNGN